MKFICAQPATIDYYTWQVEVMINNFIRNGINPNDIVILGAINNDFIPEKWKKLASHYNTVQFHFYNDKRVKPTYISSVRLDLLYQHWLKHPELEKETIFYHDCDIVFSGPVNFDVFLNDDICYVSDTVSYVGAKYIQSKGEHYLDMMSKIVNVNKKFLLMNDQDSGGAQYILKNVPTELWKKAYYDSENLWRMVNAQIREDKPEHPIQIWCADMWAVLWNLWFFDKLVKVSTKLSFSWATSAVQEWDKHLIYHNAGVVDGTQGLFFKGQYQQALPYDIKLEDFKTDKCSIKYVEEILKTKEVTCLK
jgi:hypothetical protein